MNQPQKQGRLDLDARCLECPTRIACVAKHLSDEDRRSLPNVFKTATHCTKGDHLFVAGDPATAQFHVRSGMFKTYVINAEGDEFVTGFHLPGDALGTVRRSGRHVEWAMALNDATACRLVLDDLANDAPGTVVAAFCDHLAERHSLNTHHEINLRQSSAEARFAGFCLQMRHRLGALQFDPDHLPTPMTRTDIASYLGLTLESLSRVVSRMNRAGIITAKRDHIRILKPDAVEMLGLHIQ